MRSTFACAPVKPSPSSAPRRRQDTLINAIAGLCVPASGSIRFEGHELVGHSPHRIVEMGIATVPENRRLFEPMSVMENLNLGAYVGRAPGGARG